MGIALVVVQTLTFAGTFFYLLNLVAEHFDLSSRAVSERYDRGLGDISPADREGEGYRAVVGGSVRSQDRREGPRTPNMTIFGP